MTDITSRVVNRHLARKMDKLVPVINRKKDRIVYVLPETADTETSTYEHVPEDSEDHIKYHGKPRRPDRPRKPKLPHKPDRPRATTPAPVHPARRTHPALPVPHIKEHYIHPVPHTKDPSPVDEPRRWKVKRNPKPLQARVLDRWLERVGAKPYPEASENTE